VRHHHAKIRIEVEDNGIGVNAQALSGVGSLGVVGMRERAVACGGTLAIRSESGRGTTIIVEIPIAAS
jgi:two-component system sensor histidine kinase NreB